MYTLAIVIYIVEPTKEIITNLAMQVTNILTNVIVVVMFLTSKIMNIARVLTMLLYFTVACLYIYRYIYNCTQNAKAYFKFSRSSRWKVQRKRFLLNFYFCTEITSFRRRGGPQFKYTLSVHQPALMCKLISSSPLAVCLTVSEVDWLKMFT